MNLDEVGKAIIINSFKRRIYKLGTEEYIKRMEEDLQEDKLPLDRNIIDLGVEKAFKIIDRSLVKEQRPIHKDWLTRAYIELKQKDKE